MKVLAFTRYDTNGASSRVRLLQYIPHLEKAGTSVATVPLLSNDYLSRLYSDRPLNVFDIVRSYVSRMKRILSGGQYDVVWIEKELFPWLPYFIERLFLSGSTRLVLDFDDAVYLRYLDHHSAIVRWLLHDKLDKLMRRADMVTAGSRFIMDYAVDAGVKNVMYLPSVVDLDGYPVRKMDENDITTIGWIGSPATQHYLTDLGTVLADICRQHDLQLLTIGANPVSIPGIRTRSLPWAADTEAGDLAGVDIGIMPLRNGPWEQGKCGYKLVQYMACGIPVIASAVGMNCELIKHGVNGFLAATDAEWIAAFNQLINDHDLYKSMSINARQTVADHYSVQACLDQFISTLQN